MVHSRVLVRVALTVFLAALVSPISAQQKFGVIDVGRVMTQSARGKKVLADIETVQAQKQADLKVLQEELVDLQRRIANGQLSLSEETLRELQGDLEDKSRAFERAREDAQRVIQKRQTDEMAKVENEIFSIINDVGQEMGFTLIFNKFQGALVYADDSVDVTDQVVQRFDAARASN